MKSKDDKSGTPANDKKPAKRIVLDSALITEVKDIIVEWVDVPEWGDGAGVYIKELSSLAKDKYETFVRKRVEEKKPNLEGIRPHLCARCMCDENGIHLWNDKRVGGETLAEKTSKAIETIFDACLKMNRLRIKDVEAQLKKSETTQSDASS